MPQPKIRPAKSLFFWIAAGIVIITLWSLIQNPSLAKKDVPFSKFMTEAEAGRVADVVVQDNQLRGAFTDGQAFKTVIPAGYNDFIKALREKNPGVNIVVKDSSRSPLFALLLSWFPILLMILFWVFMMRQMQAGGNKAMSFGKSRAKLFSGQQKKLTFKDVAGVEEAEEELGEIIEFLKEPRKFQRLGGRIPKGVLLVGPPGTGKTLLARAVAGEADVPFFSISGSDFVEMFVGVGASRVRDLFDQGKKHAPCLIFIDEIDAVGRQRGAGLGGGHDEREQTLNQLLVEMDGFDANEGVILLAATNRPDVLDPALLRPGRFDRTVVVDRPDVRGREGILRVHCAGKPLAPDVDLQVLARGTPGLSGADLENLVNEAALLAARRGHEAIAMAEFEEAKDKVMMGTERRSLLITPEEKKITAYHEAGHALVAWFLPDTDPLHKVTIIPRGQALGLTHWLPVDERHMHSRDYLEQVMAATMGGRAAEEIVYGHFTTGAASDITSVTGLARRMVCQWGMSERLGPIQFGSRDELIFLGKEISQQKDYSEETAQIIDEEVHRIIGEAYRRARQILEEKLDKLHALAKALLEREILDGNAVGEILGNGDRPQKFGEETGLPPAEGAVELPFPSVESERPDGGKNE